MKTREFIKVSTRFEDQLVLNIADQSVAGSTENPPYDSRFVVMIQHAVLQFLFANGTQSILERVKASVFGFVNSFIVLARRIKARHYVQKYITLLVLLCLLAVPAFGQGARYD